MAAEDNGFEESVYWYERLMNHLGRKDCGKVLCGGVFNIGDIERNEKLEDAYRLGSTLFPGKYISSHCVPFPGSPVQRDAYSHSTPNISLPPNFSLG